MKNLKEYLEEQINENLIQAVLSAGRKADGPSKVKIRPVKLKDQICYQASALEGTKVFHKIMTGSRCWHIWRLSFPEILDSFSARAR